MHFYILKNIRPEQHTAMENNKVLLLCLLFFAFACSPCYPQAGRASTRDRSRTRTGGGNDDNEGPPRPFQFNYNAVHDDGSTNYHQSQGDGTGTVRGSYGYTDANGLYRVVEYWADDTGFHATVRTNEPGTSNADPADVDMVAEPPPEAVVRRYSRSLRGWR